MSKFRTKPSVIEATRWFTNGDHPLDHPNGEDKSTEGQVVRRYRDPSTYGDTICKHCGGMMHDHGWIDVPNGGYPICPGDWIITGEDGYYYPSDPVSFEMTYEPVN